MPPDAPEFLDVREVARMLNVSAMTVLRKLKTGEMPAVRIGRQFRIRVTDLDAYLQAQTLQPTPKVSTRKGETKPKAVRKVVNPAPAPVCLDEPDDPDAVTLIFTKPPTDTAIAT